MEEKNIVTESITTDEFIKHFKEYKPLLLARRVLYAFSCLLAIFVICGIVIAFKNVNIADLNTEGGVTIAISPSASTGAKRDLISIPSGAVKANPFLPYRNIDGLNEKVNVVDDVPQYDLLEPPEFADTNSEASRVMDTVVSGIMYDKHSPSAILNIEGNDYLVKNGDVVNKYKVVSINQDSVTVKLGNNTYKAGIGEILTEGDVTKNDISNLNKKFGGKKNEI